MKKIRKEEFIKSSVVFHPIMHNYIQKLRSIALDSGVDLSYSAAVNAMVIGQVLTTAYGIDEGLKLLWNFMLDKKTIEEMNRKDIEEQWKNEIRKKLASALL